MSIGNRTGRKERSGGPGQVNSSRYPNAQVSRTHLSTTPCPTPGQSPAGGPHRRPWWREGRGLPRAINLPPPFPSDTSTGDGGKERFPWEIVTFPDHPACVAACESGRGGSGPRGAAPVAAYVASGLARPGAELPWRAYGHSL